MIEGREKYEAEALDRAERAVLGSILLEPSAIGAVMPILTEGDFSHQKHREVFRLAVAVNSRGLPVDLLTVRDEASRNGGTEKAGGDAFLAALMDGVPDVGSVEAYARLVKERATRRAAIHFGETLVTGAKDLERPLPALFEEAQAAADALGAAGGVGAWASPVAVLRGSPLRNAPRVKTGLARLDAATGGGLPIGSVFVLQGAPGTGKTTLSLQISRAAMEQLGAQIIAFLGDEGLEPASVKLGQQIGLRRQDLEACDEKSLSDLQAYCGGIEFVQPEEDLRVTLAKIRRLRRYGEKRPLAFVLDNLQGCNFELEDSRGNQTTDRLRLSAVMAELRRTARATATLIIVISEVSRGAYASKDPEKRTAALASGAETRAIEYKADVMLHLTEKSEGFVDAEVAKNRPGGGEKPRLRLRHDKQRAIYEEIDLPAAEEERETRNQERRITASSAAQKRIQEAMKKYLPEEIAANRPGLSENRLAQKARLSRTRENFQDALAALEAQGILEEILGPNRAHFWRWKGGKVPGDA